MTSYRRMSGLSKAHFDSIDLRDPALMATLPFDQNRVRRYITDQVLFRTRQRWTWFTEAQKLSPALGTLCYLPPEVRSLIWQALLYDRETLSTDGMWEYDRTLGSPLDMSAYYFGFGRRRCSSDEDVNGLRLASSMLKLEFEETFLSKHSFRFNYAENLASFFDRLEPTKKARVLSIDIGICPLYYLDPWMGPITQLPTGLLYIRFRLYPIFVISKPDDRISSALKYLQELVIRAAKSAPHAQVSICSTTSSPLPRRFQIAADATMARLRDQSLAKD